MASENPYQLSRSDLENILFSDNSDVRSRFRENFADPIQKFLTESERTCGRLRGFTHAVSKDRRAAWTESFLFGAFNSLVTSCHLLISGFPIPAGNLMRHYGEAAAMALLCSHHDIHVVEQLNKDKKFAVQKAVQNVQKNAKRLKINRKAWKGFEDITKWYDHYSHASVFSLATLTIFSRPGTVILGSGFDDEKQKRYRNEIELRISSMARLYEFIEAVEQNVKAAQAHGLVQ